MTDARDTAAARKKLPFDMKEASTHSTLMQADAESKRWLYYQKPVRNYLVGLNCPEQDLDDLTQEVLMRLQTHIMTRYNSDRPFRPYFKAAIRNLYFNHLRHKRAEEKAYASDRESGHLAEDDLMEGLRDYARQVYEIYRDDAPPNIQTGVKMLHAWIIDDMKQSDLARAWSLTERQVRTHMNRAADHLARWMQRRINLDDLKSLAALGGDSMHVSGALSSFRGLFHHISQRKRKRVMLILSAIYRKNSADKGKES